MIQVGFSPKKVFSTNSNELIDAKKCEIDLKGIEIPDELKKRLSFYKKNKLFHEPEKTKKTGGFKFFIIFDFLFFN